MADAIVRAMQSLSQFRGESENAFRRWLANILSNVLRDCIRFHQCQKRNASQEFSLQSDSKHDETNIAVVLKQEMSPLNHLLQEEKNVILSILIQALPEMTQEVITRINQGQSASQVAEELSMSVEAVYKHWQRGVVVIKESQFLSV